MNPNTIFLLLGFCTLIYEAKEQTSCTVCCNGYTSRDKLPQVCSTFLPEEITAAPQSSPSPFELNVVQDYYYGMHSVSITATNGTSMTEWIIVGVDIDGEPNGVGKRNKKIPGYWETNQSKRAHKCCEPGSITMIYEFGPFQHKVGVNASHVYNYYCACGHLRPCESKNFMLRAIVFRNRSEYWIINKQVSITRPKNGKCKKNK